MTEEEAKSCINTLLEIGGSDGFDYKEIEALKMAIQSLDIVNDFKSARIITGGRLNARAYAYKCGLADGQRLAKGEKIFMVLPLEQQESEDK